MKNLLLIALLLTLATGTALAKQRGDFKGPPRGESNPIERLTDQLDLDADQVTAITAIFEESRALRDQEREAFQAVLCNIRTDTHTQVTAELTPEQQALFEDLRQKREESKNAFMETHPERKFGGRHGMSRHGMMDCDG